MNQPERILTIEIRTMDNPGFDSTQLSTLTAFSDSSNNLYLASNLKPLKPLILEAIIHLGSNYRHPLLFNVQVLPGDEIDALIASVENARNRIRRLRQHSN